MGKTATPLRYPGGKSGLSGFVKVVLARNHLVGGEYVEPYCGGAGIAMELLQSEFVQRVHLNDVDPVVHAFWWSVVNEHEKLCAKISSARLSVANWRRQRSVMMRPFDHESIDVGFAAFFLNRVNRSGILTAGPIGGLKQLGDWGMDARFNRSALIALIENIARYSDRISLYCEDAIDFISLIASRLPKQSLIYVDPPYVVKGQRLYLNAYEKEDHEDISKAIQRVKRVPWIVSYDNDELIQRLYAKRRTLTYEIGYSANVRSSGDEIMIFSDGLNVPDVGSPAGIHKHMLRALMRAA